MDIADIPTVSNSNRYYLMSVVAGRTKKLLITPSSQVVCTNEFVRITCLSDTKPKWTINKKPLRLGISRVGQSIHIPIVRVRDAGIYVCKGKFEGKVFIVNSTLLVGGK